MVRCLLFFLSFLFLAADCLGQKKKSRDPATSKNFTVQELTPGVWAAIHNDQYGKAICNAGIIDLGDRTLVFDPFMTPEAATELRNLAEQLTHRPVTIVVNSHFHNDHIRGNQVFVPFATIISSSFTRDQIAIVEPEQQKWEKHNAPVLLKAAKKIYQASSGFDRAEMPIWIGYYEGMMESNDDLEITLPDIVFTDSLWILGSKRNVKLVEFKNCHTASDVALFLPSDKIAFLGDLLFVERHPWIPDGTPATWQLRLQEMIDDASYKTYVPGHGPVSDKNGLKDLKGYLGKLQQMAEVAAIDSTGEQLLKQPVPDAYQNWHFTKFYQNNIKFLLSSFIKPDR